MKNSTRIKLRLVMFTAMLMLSAAAAGAQTGPTTVTVQLNAAANDASEDSSGAVSLNGVGLSLGDAVWIAGLRFANVNVPKGVKIDSAYIEFDSPMNGTGTAELTIRGEAVDNSQPFSADSYNISARPVFDTSVAWTITGDWTSWMDPKPRTPELATLVQEMTDLSDWDPGDAMTFIIRSSTFNSRWVSAYDFNASKAAKLTIVYSVYKLEVRTLQTTGSDDLFQTKSSTTSSLTDGNYVDLGTTTSGTVVCAGLRFQDVNLPREAIITDAKLKFKAYASASAGTSTKSIAIVGEKVLGPKTYATAASPSTNPDLPINRKANSPLTASSVAWNNIQSWTMTNTYTSPSIANIIQEIVNQPNWHTYTSANYKAISLFLSGNDLRRVYSSHSNQNYAPSLYIEYRVADSTSAGQPKMIIAPEQLAASRTCSQGQSVMSSQIRLANIGTGTLNLTATVTYQNGSGWLGVSPVGTGTMSVEAGAEQLIFLNYQTNLPTGEYKATVRLSDPNSQPASYDIAVSLAVNPATTRCQDYPIYIKETAQPAVMVLLDLSDSMGKFADFTEGVTLPKTPNLRDLVMRLVSKSDWASGNSMVFNIRRESGSPLCKARSYDGSTATSPMLAISYVDASLEEKTVNVRVKGGLEDGYVSGSSWLTSEPELELGGQNSYGLFLRFSNIDVPQNAYITDARLYFVPTQTAYGDLLLRIRVQDSGAPLAFVSGTTPTVDTTGRTWYPAGNIDTGVGWTPGAWTALHSRLKIDMAKEAIRQLVRDERVSWGYGTWAQHANWQAAGESPLTYTRIHVGCKPFSNQHYNDLLAAIDATTVAGSLTPFAPSLLGAENYFKGLKPAENGGSYSVTDCQPKILINVSDGNGNVESTEQQVTDAAKALAAAGISAAGIGFVLPADEGTCLRRLAEVSNQEGDANSGDEVYALHPVQGGQAQYFNAGNETELLQIFQSIIGSFKRANFFSATPAVTSVQYKDRLLVSSWSTQIFRGDLLSVQRDSNGEFREVEWSAYDNLVERTSPRKVWTVDPSAVTSPVVPFTDDNVLCLKLGMIINSSPVVVGPPPFYYNYDDYKNFAYARAVTNPREPMVYVGANDGLLHAFKLVDGSESWAFMPASMRAKMAGQLYCSSDDPIQCHMYTMDASPKLADVRARVDSQDQWRTLLVVGQRKGGTAYTALDVTSGRPFDDPAEPSRYLWDYPAPGQTDDDLGETWAEPEIERVKDGSGTVWAAYFTSGYAPTESQQANKQAYLYALNAYTGQPIWTSGVKLGLGISDQYRLNYTKYSAAVDPFLPKDGYWIHRNWQYWQGDNSFHTCDFKVDKFTHDAAGKSGTAFFKAASIKSAAPPYPSCFEPTGETYFSVLDQVPYVNFAQNAWASGPPTPVAQANNALNSPLAVDIDGDYIADTIYTGDLYGNMYRITNIGKGETPVSSLVSRFDPVPTTPGIYSIRGKATYARTSVKDTIWVFYGTGRYETWEDTPYRSPSVNPQFIFGIKDTKVRPSESPQPAYVQATGSGTSPRPPVLRTCNYLVDLNGKKLRLVTGAGNNGESWGLRLGATGVGDGERVITKPLVVGGIVFFTTFTPDLNSCGGGGETYLFALDYATGLPTTHAVFDLNGDGKFTDADKVEVTQADGTKVKVSPAGLRIGRGVGSAPVLFKNTIFITTTAPMFGEISTGTINADGLHAVDVNIPQNKVSLESWKHN